MPKKTSRGGLQQRMSNGRFTMIHLKITASYLNYPSDNFPSDKNQNWTILRKTLQFWHIFFKFSYIRR